MVLLEVGHLGGLVPFMVSIWLVPPTVLFIIGRAIKKNNPSGAKVLFILGTIYLLVGGGICGLLLA